MMLVVWIVVGVGAFFVLAVLGYGLFGHLTRLRGAASDAQISVAPQVEDLTQGIRRAQTLRMQNEADRSRGQGGHA
ncbi:MAG: hypothetical protein ACR2I7_11650 [Geodermatophilaceae bacterium]|jgi:hypothetical protein